MSAIPWYKSKIIVGAGVSILSKMLSVSGVIDIDDHTTDQIVETLVLVAGGVGDLVAIASRVRQKEAPIITASKGGAEIVKQATEVVESAARQIIDPNALRQATAAADAYLDNQKLEVPSWMQR